MVFRSITPGYLSDMFAEMIASYDFLNAAHKLILPTHKLTVPKMQLFLLNGAFLWSSLPEETRADSSLSLFKK